VAIQIFSTSSVAAKGQKILVQGGPGSGKTPLIATLAQWSPITFASEEGLLSLSKHNLPYISVKSEAELIEAYNWLNSSNEAKQFGAVCWDSVSETADIMVDHKKNAKGASKDHRANYWDVMEDLLNWGRKFSNLNGRHVYVIAKEFSEKDELTGVIKYFPHVGAKSLGPQFAYLFDCLFRLRRDDQFHPGQPPIAYLQCDRTKDCDCRVRDPRGLVQLWEAADLGAIINKLQS